MNCTDSEKSCLIIAGGEFAPLPFPEHYDFIIACDHGFEYTQALGVRPDLIIGDFDSAASVPAPSIPVKRLPAMKDDTDTMSAVKFALSEGYRMLTICCAFGGRFDHSLANVQTAAFIAEQGAFCMVCGKDTRLYAIKNRQLQLPKTENAYLSVFAIRDCTGVSLSGTKYELDHAGLSCCFPLGVSNEWAGETALISVDSGILAVLVCTKD